MTAPTADRLTPLAEAVPKSITPRGLAFEGKAIDRFLAQCHRRRYPSRTSVFMAGDRADVLYYVIDGSLSVVAEDEDGRGKGGRGKGRRAMSVEVVTFGCRLNAYESEMIRREAEGAGLRDTVVVNSCAVTGEAVRQARQAIRRLRRARPQARIVVTGCAAQTETATFAGMPEVDRVIGNDEKFDAARLRGDDTRVAVGDIMRSRVIARPVIGGQAGRTRAFVQVQNGCDHRCTFCIIPYGRGNSRSLGVDDVVAQVRRLVDNGYREVVLTGVDIVFLYRGNAEAARESRAGFAARVAAPATVPARPARPMGRRLPRPRCPCPLHMPARQSKHRAGGAVHRAPNSTPNWSRCGRATW